MKSTKYAILIKEFYGVRKCTMLVSDFTGIFLGHGIRSSFSQGLTELGSLVEFKSNAFSSTLEIVSFFTIFFRFFPSLWVRLSL